MSLQFWFEPKILEIAVRRPSAAFASSVFDYGVWNQSLLRFWEYECWGSEGTAAFWGWVKSLIFPVGDLLLHDTSANMSYPPPKIDDDDPRHCWYESCCRIIYLLLILTSAESEPTLKELPMLAYCCMTMSNSCFEYSQVFTVPSRSILAAGPTARKKSEWTVDFRRFLRQYLLISVAV